MSLFTKLKWISYYYNKSPKGRFERNHILQLLFFLLLCISVLETVLYLCLAE